MKRLLLVAVVTVVAALTAVGTAAAWDNPTTPPSPPTQSIEQGQGNQSSQSQVQVVPIAPQVNVQNVNVLTGGNVDQGDANNANTGQANQQQNTQVAVQKDGGGDPSGGPSQTVDQGQGNHSSQGQLQIVPIAPQVNVQNVNVGTYGDVQQGDANNANTGQANQQHDTQVAVQKSSGGSQHDGCNCPSGPPPGDPSISQHQGNSSTQKQVQIIPIAPQANVQNVNVLTFGDVHQGDANNANTGQANQQQNTQVAVQKAGKAGERSCAPPWSVPSGSTSQSVSQHQGNHSWQKQLQFIPIAPQLNAQNVNFLTWGYISQGDVNNANTGQANQQESTQLAFQRGGWSIA